MTPPHLESETEPLMVEKMMAVTEGNYSLAREYFSLKKQTFLLLLLREL